MIERDRAGYLEALSKTKTTFRGINPHDPFDGIVLNGGINPDFVMLLERNFFKENSENLDRDELYFVRYETERNKMIGWLQSQFKELAIDDEYLRKELGVSQEELFQNLMSNIFIFATKVESGEIILVDTHSYLEGIKNQSFYDVVPQKFCNPVRNDKFCKNLVFLKYIRNELERQANQKRQEAYERERTSALKGIIFSLVGILATCLAIFLFLSLTKY